MHIISKTTSETGSFGEEPCTLAVEVTEALKQRIKEMQAVVVEHKMHCAQSWFYDATWSVFDSDAEGLEYGGEELDIAALLQRIDDAKTPVDVPLLLVTATTFKFTAVPKDGLPIAQVESEPCPIEDLDGSEDIVLLDSL